MIIVLKPSATEEQITKFTNMLKESYDVKVNKWDGVQSTVLGLIGDTTKIDIEYIDAQDIVENVKRVQEPYKKANRKFHPDNTVIKINDNVTIGDGSLHIMAGPCSVESEEQIVQIAKDVKASGATLLRGGAFKPRTSPYAFQGLKAEGLDLLKTARRETGLPIRLCSAKEVSAHTKHLQETLLIFRLSRLSKSFPTFLLLLIRAMLRASHGLLNRLQWQQLPQVQTVLS